jgi:hypothetical protein
MDHEFKVLIKACIDGKENGDVLIYEFDSLERFNDFLYSIVQLGDNGLTIPHGLGDNELKG